MSKVFLHFSLTFHYLWAKLLINFKFANILWNYFVKILRFTQYCYLNYLIISFKILLTFAIKNRYFEDVVLIIC